MTKEKIQILKRFRGGEITRVDLHMFIGGGWKVATDKLIKLKNEGLVINLYNGLTHWQITPEGIAAIKKWDLYGTPGKLFEEVKE